MMEKIWVIYKIDGNTGRETIVCDGLYTEQKEADNQCHIWNNATMNINTYYAKTFVAVEEENEVDKE